MTKKTLKEVQRSATHKKNKNFVLLTLKVCLTFDCYAMGVVLYLTESQGRCDGGSGGTLAGVVSR
jgi:hypothetical protein